MDQENNFGTIVNDREGQKPTLPLDEARLILRISDDIFNRLLKAASFYNYPSVEDFCIHKLIESIQTKAGAAHIESPSFVNGQEAKKISGPSNSGMIRRG